MSVTAIDVSKTKGSSPDRRKLLMSSCAVLLTMLAACSSVSDYPLYPSYDELAHKGFYVYVVPEGEVTRRGWLQTVWIYSWDLHCKRLGPETSPNPISVSYRGPDDRKEMGIVISPRSIAWDHGWPSEEVSLRFPWTKDNAAEYYIEDGLLTIQFEDWLGTSVEITSRLPLTEVVGLINRLEYHGPPREMVSNPWDYTKCQD